MAINWKAILAGAGGGFLVGGPPGAAIGGVLGGVLGRIGTGNGSSKTATVTLPGAGTGVTISVPAADERHEADSIAVLSPANPMNGPHDGFGPPPGFIQGGNDMHPPMTDDISDVDSSVYSSSPVAIVTSGAVVPMPMSSDFIAGGNDAPPRNIVGDSPTDDDGSAVIVVTDAGPVLVSSQSDVGLTPPTTDPLAIFPDIEFIAGGNDAPPQQPAKIFYTDA